MMMMMMMMISGEHNESVVSVRVRRFEEALSSRPLNCRKFINMFEESGVYKSPLHTVKGHRKLYRFCETNHLFGEPLWRGAQSVLESTAFVHSHPVAFSPQGLLLPRSLNLLTNETFCRIHFQGYAIAHYSNASAAALITTLEDFFDPTILERDWRLCSWPIDEYPEVSLSME